MKLDLQKLWFSLPIEIQSVISNLSVPEIVTLAECIRAAADGDTPPFIKNGSVYIPFDSPRKYWWWHPDGQSLDDTLNELNADEEVVRKYIPNGGIK